KFMLLIYGEEAAAARATDGERQAEAAAYEEFTQSIRASGNYLDGDPFLPTSAARTVQLRGGEAKSTDGPAVNSAPQLLAYYKVEAETAEQAVEMASRIPGARFGSIEVRPVMQFD
ncbi:MAG TPA: YciI family protein, partial [Actinomycetota bacterium]|nr:YciI family protein [Actinomycetota bacterium]